MLFYIYSDVHILLTAASLYVMDNESLILDVYKHNIISDKREFKDPDTWEKHLWLLMQFAGFRGVEKIQNLYNRPASHLRHLYISVHYDLDIFA